MKMLLALFLLAGCCPSPAEIRCIPASASYDCRAIDLGLL